VNEEFNPDTDQYDSEVDQLVENEKWAQNVASVIHAEKGIDLRTALAGARWAAIWYEDFRRLAETQTPSTISEVRLTVITAKRTSLDRCQAVPRCSFGEPTLIAISAADEAFCIAFGGAGKKVRGLLS
jgi:hypothetical protein